VRINRQSLAQFIPGRLQFLSRNRGNREPGRGSRRNDAAGARDAGRVSRGLFAGARAALPRHARRAHSRNSRRSVAGARVGASAVGIKEPRAASDPAFGATAAAWAHESAVGPDNVARLAVAAYSQPVTAFRVVLNS
jgi:hypothetical protein